MPKFNVTPNTKLGRVNVGMAEGKCHPDSDSTTVARVYQDPFLDIEFDNLNGERRFSTQHAYYHAKLAQVMYTYTLAERLKGIGVTVNCVRVTNVAVPDDRLTHLPGWVRGIYKLKRRMAITPERQAETYVYLAANPAVQAITGGYWDENNHQVRSNKNAYSRETWFRLWRESERMAGITSLY